jgi:hypothetical protein
MIRKLWTFLLLAWMGGIGLGNGAIVSVSPGDVIECTGFVGTPLPTSLPAILAACIADTRCAELYGQNLGPDLALFNHLFQTTNEVPLPVFFESTFILNVCNRTVEEATVSIWQRELRAAMADSEVVCGLNDRPLYDVDSGEIVCFPFPGRETRDPNAVDVIQLTFLILLLVAVTTKVFVDVWDTSLRWRTTRLLGWSNLGKGFGGFGGILGKGERGKGERGKGERGKGGRGGRGGMGGMGGMGGKGK